MVRSHTVLVLTHYPAKKSLLVVVSGECWWWWQTEFSVSPGPGLWPLVLGPFGPDLGPDLGPGPGPELDNKIVWWVVDKPITDRILGSSLRFDVRDGPELDNFKKVSFIQT